MRKFFFYTSIGLLNNHYVQKESGTGMTTSWLLPTFSFRLRVVHLQIPDEQLSLWIADCLVLPSQPPKAYTSPWFSRREVVVVAFGKAGPNVRKNEMKEPKLLIVHTT